jgi:hypothetical protein
MSQPITTSGSCAPREKSYLEWNGMGERDGKGPGEGREENGMIVIAIPGLFQKEAGRERLRLP